MKQRQRADVGFTLIELLIIVLIIAILAAIAVPMFSHLIATSQEGSTKGNLGALRSSLSIYYGDNDQIFPQDDLSSLTIQGRYLKTFPVTNLPHTFNNVGHGLQLNQVSAGAFPAAINDVVDGVSGWAYDNSGDANWGEVVVNCTHSDSTAGTSWSAF